MSEDLFGEKLAWFKQNESPEAVLLVAGDSERIRVAVAWTHTRVARASHISELTGLSENEAWDWLWENVRYSAEELVAKIGIPLSECGLERKLRPLVGNRVLYPDGTLNSFVQRYLRDQVLKLFEAKPRHPTKR